MRKVFFPLLVACGLVGACRQETSSESSAQDRRITGEVRRAIAGVQALSAHWERVTVVTHDGVVQLLGPVESGQEKALIGALAADVSGVRRIDNQLEIVPTK